MALIGRIRNNTWLLIAFIGMGLGLFIITSMFVGNQIPGLGSQTSTGSINGQEIEWDQFTNAEDALKGRGDIYSQRSAIWNFFVEDAIVNEQADALGFAVSEEELEELQFGNNLSPIVSGRFTDPTTRQVDRNQLAEIKTALESGNVNPDYLKYWNYQKKEIIKDKLQSRMNNLVSKSIYTPTWMLEQSHVDKTQNASFDFVKIPFESINNSEVKISDSDLETYLADNKMRFYKEEQTRKLNYVVFDIAPSTQDSANLRQDMGNMVDEFRAAPNDTIFVEAREGLMDPRFHSREDIDKPNSNTNLNGALADALFNASIGDVVGPIIDGNKMKIAKLIDRLTIADSAKCRHILIAPLNFQRGQIITEKEYLSAENTIDSLKTLLETGQASFDSLVIKHSTDRGSIANNGEYDWAPVNSYVPAFEKVVFRTGEIGKLYSVRTPFGVHLIEPTGRKYIDEANKFSRIKVAVVAKSIVPSEDTQDQIKTIAQDFMADNRSLESLVKSASEKGLKLEISILLRENDYNLDVLGTGVDSRDVIKWAYNSGTDIGDVAPEVYSYQDPVEYYDARYVIVALKSIQKKGVPTVDGVREELEPFVSNLKKAEVIKSRISGQDLNAIASTFSTEVATVGKSTFSSTYVNEGSFGNEPEVIAAVFNLVPNAVSTPIIGNSGVFVVKLNNKAAASPASNIPLLRRQASQATQSQITGSLLRAMKKNAEIKDLRSKFY